MTSCHAAGALLSPVPSSALTQASTHDTPNWQSLEGSLHACSEGIRGARNCHTHNPLKADDTQLQAATAATAVDLHRRRHATLQTRTLAQKCTTC